MLGLFRAAALGSSVDERIGRDDKDQTTSTWHDKIIRTRQANDFHRISTPLRRHTHCFTSQRPTSILTYRNTLHTQTKPDRPKQYEPSHFNIAPICAAYLSREGKLGCFVNLVELEKSSGSYSFAKCDECNDSSSGSRCLLIPTRSSGET